MHLQPDAEYRDVKFFFIQLGPRLWDVAATRFQNFLFIRCDTATVMERVLWLEKSASF